MDEERILSGAHTRVQETWKQGERRQSREGEEPPHACKINKERSIVRERERSGERPREQERLWERERESDQERKRGK